MSPPFNGGQYLDENDQHAHCDSPDCLQFTCDSPFTGIRGKRGGRRKGIIGDVRVFNGREGRINPIRGARKKKDRKEGGGGLKLTKGG